MPSLPYLAMPLGRRREPFDHPEWIFELKYDGFRAVAVIRRGRVTLVSRRGIVYRRFDELAAAIAADITVPSAVLDGEIVCLDGDGRPQFYDLMFRRGTPCFVAFDCLALGRRDLRRRPLLERKAALRTVLRQRPRSIIRTDHVDGPYVAAPPTTWWKIKNPAYSQQVGRHKLFTR